MLERLGLLFWMALPYGFVYGALSVAAGLVLDIPPAPTAIDLPILSGPDSPPWIPFDLLLMPVPLLVCLLAETVTSKWARTPGALGTGSLVVALPMFALGLLCAVAHLVLRAVITGGDTDATAWTAWTTTTGALAVVGWLLWSRWPAPRARLW